MYFSEHNVKELEKAQTEALQKYEPLLRTLLQRTFSNPIAKEFATHGFGRRLKTLYSCMENIYEICPPRINRKLFPKEREDLQINLQAFILNVYGALDNLAWVWVKEKNILNNKRQPLGFRQIGLTKKCKIVRNSFSPDFQNHLNTHDDWFSYLEGFRHSLAHRIPLYVPPYILNPEEAERENELNKQGWELVLNFRDNELAKVEDEINQLGKFVPLMTHSFSEKSPHAIFHVQIIADWNTVIEISNKFMKELDT